MHGEIGCDVEMFVRSVVPLTTLIIGSRGCPLVDDHWFVVVFLKEWRRERLRRLVDDRYRNGIMVGNSEWSNRKFRECFEVAKCRSNWRNVLKCENKYILMSARRFESCVRCKMVLDCRTDVLEWGDGDLQWCCRSIIEFCMCLGCAGTWNNWCFRLYRGFIPYTSSTSTSCSTSSSFSSSSSSSSSQTSKEDNSESSCWKTFFGSHELGVS